MTPEEFLSLASEGYNRIPVVREVLADLDTPLSVYLKLADGPYSYLFESVHGGEKWGRYSIIGLPGRLRLEVRGDEITFFDGDSVTRSFQADDPLAVVDEFQQSFHAAEIDGLPRFSGGLVGYFSYDTIRYIEPRLKQSPNPDTLQTPDILLMVSDELVVFDNLSGRMFIIVHADPTTGDTLEQAQQRIGELAAKICARIREEGEGCKWRYIMGTAKSNAKVYKIDTEEDVKFLTEDFAKENEELFRMLMERLNSYAQNGNVLYMNWMSQALINLLKDANDQCKFKLLGIDEKTKMQ